MKPFAESCEKNKDVILDVLATEYGDTRRVLEIGSGTGQQSYGSSVQTGYGQQTYSAAGSSGYGRMCVYLNGKTTEVTTILHTPYSVFVGG